MSFMDTGASCPDAANEEDLLPRNPKARVLDGRFVILASPEIKVADLVAALNRAGFALRATPGGWHLDCVHAIALVLKDGDEGLSVWP